jgi:hypothetical protein
VPPVQMALSKLHGSWDWWVAGKASRAREVRYPPMRQPGYPNRQLRVSVAPSVVVVSAIAALLIPASASGAPTKSITAAGTIAGLKLDVARRPSIVAAIGLPEVQEPATLAGCDGLESACGGPPSFLELGYGCPSDVPANERLANCQTQYYLSAKTGRLVAFATGSPSYVLEGHLRVGSNISEAAKILHAPVGEGCDESAAEVEHAGNQAILAATGAPHGKIARMDVLATSLKPSDIPFGVGLSC